MSYSGGGGGTLTVPSPTHVHHVDVLATSVRSLRRSLSRSPSRFNLARTNPHPHPHGSDSPNNSHSPVDRSPCRRYSPSMSTRSQTPSQQPATTTPPSNFVSTTPQHPPPTASSIFSPNVKLSLRSAKKQSSTPPRPFSRLRASPKSPLKRTLSVTNETDIPGSMPGPDSPGQENSSSNSNNISTTPRSPLPRSSIPRRPLEKSSRHSLHLDVSGSVHQNIFRAMDNSELPPGTAGSGALKRSDAIMDLDQPNVSSPVAKRRSLHGIASFGYTETGANIFGGSTPVPSSTNFEIHDDTSSSNREYELFGSGSVAHREPLPSPTPPAPSIPRRTGSLRKSTLQQRQHDRSSWGRRSGANHLAQMSGDFSTPNAKNRPRLSLDQFLPPQINRDSPFSSSIPLPNPSVHPVDRSSNQPHPLSKTLTTSSSGPRHGRRGSLLSLDGEDKKFTFESNHVIPLGVDIDAPPTPTKQSTTPTFGNLSARRLGAESPTANRSISIPFSAVRPEISRESTASPVEQHTPRTPQAAVIIPDASCLSISNAHESTPSQGVRPPVTPSGRESFQSVGTQLMTPVNGRGNGDIDDSLYARFDKVELVGKGEFSSVFRVVKCTSARASFLSIFNGTPSRHSPGSPEPDRIYAVKKARRAIMGPKDRENKMREVHALQALTHADHVIHYVDSWEHELHLFIQTEFCDEGTLDKFLSNVGCKGRLDDFRIWKVIHDISLGLQSIHDAGFIHLDLKPANILITFEGILKIGDFGLATAWPAAKGVDAEGDREYIGPEILRGKFDKPADIYSLGLILVEMACNVVLPDNGPAWVALRSGDFSEVPSLTFSASSATQIRDVAGVPTGLSQDDLSLNQSIVSDIAVNFNDSFSKPPFHAGSSPISSPKRSELLSPPDFMCDAFHPDSLDQVVRWMTKPEPSERPTIQQLLGSAGMTWVADRRRSAATVFEGVWGPGDMATISSDEDTEMTDV
ncbi:mitosis inhibitor protein kinase SWE1 [Verticillium alfalfae VaMs.102]|uniref:Mitosis inhibitor protein kinase SWE1 n=1 Tax=Verticillium alfalfae (strain VaMs.102 / ATCC MYA-4576 / FGSC 10136) TaxID=526221 RepID=C9S5N1_VERA1|nr:mitosis inhibitor protein kinase SWE1 [Verticillium alfalfae VaMs.102]EEY14257.1 mitosis inhibitor protein kinase SWE1 [Verticillium alfalfae VaMs.102]